MTLGALWAYWAGLAVAFALAEVVRQLVRRRRIWFGAYLEQARRELEHRGPKYRPDQRVRAIQQRLSRHLGKRALGPKVKAKIERHLGLAR